MFLFETADVQRFMRIILELHTIVFDREIWGRKQLHDTVKLAIVLLLIAPNDHSANLCGCCINRDHRCQHRPTTIETKIKRKIQKTTSPSRLIQTKMKSIIYILIVVSMTVIAKVIFIYRKQLPACGRQFTLNFIIMPNKK